MIRAHLAEGPFGDTLRVFLVDQNADSRRILHVDDGEVLSWVTLPSRGEAVDEKILRPTTILPWDSGRALLEALVRHYNGAEDTRQLRKDYDAERKRVDEHAKVIASIAQTLVERR